MLFELMKMFFPLIGNRIVVQKRFNQFEYELGKSNCRMYWGLLFSPTLSTLGLLLLFRFISL